MNRKTPDDSTIDFPPRLAIGPGSTDDHGFDGRLCLVEASSGRQWVVPGEEAGIGRHSTCLIQLDAPDVSRKHCRVFRQAGTWWIRDSHSLNGVYLNGRKVTFAPLQTGDEIQIGECILQVVSGRPAADPARQVWRSIASALARAEMSDLRRRAS